MSERRMTTQTERILETLLTDPSTDWWGSRIAPASGLKSGTLYPALLRMERFGWLSSRWEDIDPVAEARPRRRLYRLTAEGYRVAESVTHAAARRAPGKRQSGLAGVPQGGMA